MNQSIAFQNHRINFYTSGRGEVLLFLHGWPTNSRLWNAQVDALKTNYKVVTMDWLGFGKSDKPNDHLYTFIKKKEILDVLIKAVLGKDKKLTIIAHDLGGPPAILWAYENQERVKRLVLLNTIIYPFSTSLDKTSHLFFGIPLIGEMLVSHFGLKTLMKTLTKSKNRIVNYNIDEILNWHDNLSSQL